MKAALFCATILLVIVVYAGEEASMSVQTTATQHPSEQKTATPLMTSNSRKRAYGTTTKFEAECMLAASKLKSTEAVEITGDTISHAVTDTTLTPPVSGITAGKRPGDMMMPDGTFAHMPTP